MSDPATRGRGDDEDPEERRAAERGAAALEAGEAGARLHVADAGLPAGRAAPVTDPAAGEPDDTAEERDQNHGPHTSSYCHGDHN